MGKNNWNAGDTATDHAMNQPYYMASGMADGTDLVVYFTPGSMRFPHGTESMLVSSGQVTAHRVANVDSDSFLFYYLRGHQGRQGEIVTSGTTGPELATNQFYPPAPPFYDAEFIGGVYTGFVFDTSNLIGPWNNPEFGTFELRPQMTAQAGAKRAIYDSRFANPAATEFAASLGSLGATASGLSFLTYSDNRNRNDVAKVSAMISWVPSGNIRNDGDTTETAVFGPTFQILNKFGDGAIASVHDSVSAILEGNSNRAFDPDENPSPDHGAEAGVVVPRTTVIEAFFSMTTDDEVTTPGGGLELRYNFGDTETGYQYRVTAIAFSVEPGFYGSDRNERY